MIIIALSNHYTNPIQTYALVWNGEILLKVPGPGVEEEAEGHHPQGGHCGAGRHTDAASEMKTVRRESQKLRTGPSLR